ncbi:hypothetical protein [Arthrobacter woluwensis]|uniref:hypothetical protein n=1 Tax=Arthrobacter woluwensis TaxID=156980 RepID=UPI00381E35A7
MGYAVYQDRTALERGVSRWAGYGVPADCDHPECQERINRGLAYQCESAECGCGLFFCSSHQWGAGHQEFSPKPDSKEWIEHLLTDGSWVIWRIENPERTESLTELLKAARS